MAPAAATKSLPAMAPAAATKSAPPPLAQTKSAPTALAASTKSAPPAGMQPPSKGAPPRPQVSAPPEATPPRSPSVSDLSDNPLYALVSELTEDPVCEEGLIKDARLNQVLKRLWDGVAQKPKDWLAAWQAMLIPGERHGEVLQKFLNMAFVQTEGHEPEQAPMIIAELTKAHKIKMNSVEEVLVSFGHNLDGVLAMNEEAWHVYAYVLLHVYPKPRDAGWGWSRVGWNWIGWWKFVEKCVASLEATKALDVLSMLLRLVQEREEKPLAQVFDSTKMKQVLPKLAELGQCPEHEVITRLSTEGITVEPAAEG